MDWVPKMIPSQETIFLKEMTVINPGIPFLSAFLAFLSVNKQGIFLFLHYGKIGYGAIA
jgi:hypothetical protein